jgi:hypothetical protein
MSSTGVDIATIIGTAYVAGLAVFAIIMVVRGKRDEAASDSPMLLPLFARFIGEQRFDPSMRANPDQFNK